MPSPEESSSRDRDEDTEYFYRRPLALGELLPAIGLAVGAGLFAFYITRLMLQRTPLKIEHAERPGGSGRRGQRLEHSSDA